MHPSSDFLKLRQGRFQIAILSDGLITLGGEIFAPEADDAERREILRRLKGSDLVADAHSNIPLIVGRDEKLLVDVGAGSRFQPGEGKLEENLRAAGTGPEEITHVVLSHAHPDHIWGMVREDGSLRFPNARYFVDRKEWDFWNGEQADALPAEVQPFVAGARRDLQAVAQRVTFVADGDEIVPGIKVLSTPGHTAGHISLVVEGDEPLIIAVDATANEFVSFEHPDWSFGFDMDPAQARVTRRRLIDLALSTHARLLGFHWAYPGIGRLVEGESLRLAPLEEIEP